jgi:hypothetical protein
MGLEQPAQDARLFVDFLEHEVSKPARSAASAWIVNGLISGWTEAPSRRETETLSRELGDFIVIEKDHVGDIVKDGRDVAGNEVFALPEAMIKGLPWRVA